MYTLRTKMALLFAGLPLRLALTVCALLAAGNLWNSPVSVRSLVEVSLVTVGLRALIRLQCGFTESVGICDDARVMVNNLKSEVKYLLGLLTLVYVTGYPAGRPLVLTFAGLNLALQFLPLCVTQLIRALRVENLGPSALLTHGLKNPGKTRTALVYGTGPKGKSVVDLLLTNSHSEISPIGFIDPHASGLWSYRDTPLIGGLKALKDTILNRQVDLLFIAAENKDLQHSQAVFDIAEKMGVPICVMPHIYKSTISECRLKTLNGQPALVYSSASEEGLSTVAKAALDKTAAVIAIVILAPVMALVAAAIKLTSKGPVLFRQTRLGENGAPFTVFKFRSMREDAEAHKGELLDENEMSGPVFKIRDDPRITRVGEFIRKYSIDELPQLFNVLRGDMSLVGPRPPLPAEVSQFTPWQRRKLAVKPGVTCIWQVSGRNGVDFDDWMKLDLEYIDNWSLWLDTKILARTIPTVLKGTGQ